MPGVSRRADDDHRPFGKSKSKIVGVGKVKELLYEGWKITLLHRDQGVHAQRVAYSARVAEIGSKTSFYVPCADNQKLVIKSAKKLIDLRVEKTRIDKTKFYTVEKVLNLWFRDDDDQTAPSTNLAPNPESIPTTE
ncbi:MAG: hypothetical protein JNK57_21370 [Planctomycetaceae bacterium]|nr:hypothetical protein [Planctomycetaceae bacterium]